MRKRSASDLWLYRVDEYFYCPARNCDFPPISVYEWNEGVCCSEGFELHYYWGSSENLNGLDLDDRNIPEEIKELKEIEKETKFLEYEAEVTRIKHESAKARLAVNLKKKKMAKRRLSRILIDAGKSFIEKGKISFRFNLLK